MVKNIIWLKNEINKQINKYSQFKNDYAFGIANGLQEALVIIEELDSVDNDVKIRKRLDMLQHQIDILQKEINQLTERKPTITDSYSHYINDGD